MFLWIYNNIPFYLTFILISHKIISNMVFLITKEEFIMKYASDFRRIARDALRGNWKIAVLTGFVAWLTGAALPASNSSGVNIDLSNADVNTLMDSLSPELLRTLLIPGIVIFALLATWVIALFIISGAGKLGYAKFNLNLIDKKTACFSDLFSQFHRIGDGICMNILVGLFTALWMLLFIIPGIIKMYSYSMTPYIYSENPQLSANDAITESRRIMDGNKWRLFCLEFSFIGWELLAAAPAILLMPLLFFDSSVAFVIWLIPSLLFAFITQLFIIPYQQAARAAFYREISHTVIPDEEAE